MLWGTLPTLRRLARTLSQCPILPAGVSESGAQCYIRDETGVSGGRDLHLSATYPADFGSSVLDAWIEAVSNLHLHNDH
eukprot:3608729-Lingulodinium_polyedra.AAC.1